MFGGRGGLRRGGIAKLTKIDYKYDRLYSIGDIHGCKSELEVLIDYLKNNENLTQEDQVVFLGDYIDRGPDSPGTVDTLIQFAKDFPKTLFLKGNHDDMFIGYLYQGFNHRHRGLYGHMFKVNGGDETLKQYGIDFGDSGYRDFPLKEIPREHRRFFLNTHHLVETEDAIFVHAGLNPYNKLDDQILEVVTWDRDFFYTANSDLGGKRVVHGHTPVPYLVWDKKEFEGFEDWNKEWQPEYKVDQINIDTGCVYHGTSRCPVGRLTCLRVKEMTAFTVTKDETEVVEVSTPDMLKTPEEAALGFDHE